MFWVLQSPASPRAGQGNGAGALGNAGSAQQHPRAVNHQKTQVLAGLESAHPAVLSRQRPGSRSAAEPEVRGQALWGLIIAFSSSAFSFLTQNVWAANTDGLADTTNRLANITHTRRGERSPTSWPSGGVYKTAKWKPKDLSLIPPVKSSRFLLATNHLISINKSWPSSPNLAESRKAEA